MINRKPGQVTNWNLIIQHVRPEDAGVYECQVTSRDGHVRHVHLNVVGEYILMLLILLPDFGPIFSDYFSLIKIVFFALLIVSHVSAFTESITLFFNEGNKLQPNG